MNNPLTSRRVTKMKKSLRLNNSGLLVTIAASLIGLALPCYGVGNGNDAGGNARAVAALLRSGWASINAGELESAKKIAANLDSSILPQSGKFLLGGVYYKEKQYQKAVDVIQPVYPIPTNDKADADTMELIVRLNTLAASTIGKAKYELKHPDTETLIYLLEGTRLQLPEGAMNDEDLDKISFIYLRQGRFSLAFGFGLERYNKYKKLYDSKTPVVDKNIEEYLHSREYKFAEILAGMSNIGKEAQKDYFDESAKWLKKALVFEKENYRDMASRNPLLKPVLDSISLQPNH